MAAKGHSRSKAKREDVEWRPVEDVIPYARNPRQATETAISKVAGSIHEFGFRVPIIVDGEGVIIAGHTRLLAAQRLGMETVPVLEAADLTPAQVKAFRIADNRIAEETEWDADLLELELDDLRELDFDLDLTGLSEFDLDALDHGDGAGAGSNGGAGSLVDSFGAPPFSVFDARQGYWQDRKRAWLALGIRSEIGRGDSLTYSSREVQDPGFYWRRKKYARAFSQDLMRGETKLGARQQ